ncbi:galactose-1-epimerase [Dellaglioa sp. BT-FLS60]
MKTTTKDFGNDYQLITMTNDNGFELSLTDLGARIVSLKVPTSTGKREIVLGFDSASEYLEKDSFIGASIGRVAGRIKDGKFNIGDQSYQVQINEGTNTLHGGTPGFDTKKWAYKIVEGQNESSVIFHLESPEGEHGFPGNMAIDVTYTFGNDNIWHLETTAKTDKDTLYNPTNHVYFNVSGDVTETIDNNLLQVDSDYFAPLEPDSIPTGEKMAVAETAYDFRQPKLLHDVFTSDFAQKKQVDGIDHPFFLNNPAVGKESAKLVSSDKEVSVSVSTDQTSLVIFTANFGEDTPIMHGKKIANHAAITFETQVAPGSERFPDFGDIVLRAGDTYKAVTEFKLN